MRNRKDTKIYNYLLTSISLPKCLVVVTMMYFSGTLLGTDTNSPAAEHFYGQKLSAEFLSISFSQRNYAKLCPTSQSLLEAVSSDCLKQSYKLCCKMGTLDKPLELAETFVETESQLIFSSIQSYFLQSSTNAPEGTTQLIH